MGKQARNLHSETVLASGAITEYRAVGFDGYQATVQGQKVLGVANRSAPLAAYVDVACIGTAVVEAGAAFAIGASLTVDASGRAITVATPATDYVFADAIRAAGAAGEFVEVLLRR